MQNLEYYISDTHQPHLQQAFNRVAHLADIIYSDILMGLNILEFGMQPLQLPPDLVTCYTPQQ